MLRMRVRVRLGVSSEYVHTYERLRMNMIRLFENFDKTEILIQFAQTCI